MQRYTIEQPINIVKNEAGNAVTWVTEKWKFVTGHDNGVFMASTGCQEVNFHTGNFRLRRNHRDPEPKTLLQLEALANRCALIMSKYEESPHHRETALKLLRQQYNLEFKLQCHKCKTAHQQDELYACAPESQEVNFHTWNFRLRRNRRVVYEDPEPKTLLQLEALANRCALMMSKYEESPHHRETALKLLRQQYNLEFKLQCHKCKTAHQQDELYACAPESQEVNFHTWNFRLRRNRRVVYEDPEPKTLLQLEALANRCALMMSKYEESPHHRETALKLLRQQYNLEFKLQCHKCKTAHQQDELYACAPER